MASTHPLVILLPGLGADERLFVSQRDVWPDLVVPRWLRPELGEDLARYAARLAEQLLVSRPLVLGGCSFGGMVAYCLLYEAEVELLWGKSSGRNNYAGNIA